MKEFKTITQKLIILGSLLSLTACGSSSAGLTITADDQTLFAGDCHAFTVTRSSPASSNLIVQPDLASGQGAVYANNTCTQLAFLNIQMTQGTDSAKFYYKSVNAGNVTVAVTTVQTLNGMPAGKDLEGSITFDVIN